MGGGGGGGGRGYFLLWCHLPWQLCECLLVFLSTREAFFSCHWGEGNSTGERERQGERKGVQNNEKQKEFDRIRNLDSWTLQWGNDSTRKGVELLCQLSLHDCVQLCNGFKTTCLEAWAPWPVANVQNLQEEIERKHMSSWNRMM